MMRIGTILAIALSFQISVGAAVLARWDFNSVLPDNETETGMLDPVEGVGVVRFFGGAMSLFGRVGGGAPGDPAAEDDTQLRITRPPTQGTRNKEVGVEFELSSRGHGDLKISWEQYNSATASRYWRVMFSADAVDWIEGPVVTQARAGAWTAHQVSLRDHGELNDAEVVWVRIAPEFESTATGSGADEYRAVGETSNYSTAGSWWMDSVTITGWEVGTSNTLPTISAVSDLELMEGETSGAMEFQIFDAETAAENLAVEASVAGAGVITNLVLGGSDVARTVRFRAEEAGEAFVTLRVTDEEGGFVEATFKVTVMASPVEPTLGPAFVQWNFNSVEADGDSATGTLEPSVGVGRFEVVGVNSVTFGSVGQGRSSDPAEWDNTMLRLSGFPSQGMGSGTAGVEIRASTAALRRIGLKWDQYNSATASRHLAIYVTTNGIDFDEFVVVSNIKDSAWLRERAVSFETLSGAENNPEFGVRIVAVHGESGGYEPVSGDANYNPVGTLWLDMVALTGEQMGNVPVLECAMVEGRIVLSWPKVMKGYVLEVCEGLGGEWNEAAEFVSENGELWEAQVAMEGSWRFYRLRKINE